MTTIPQQPDDGPLGRDPPAKPAAATVCPACGAAVGSQDRCWLCHHPRNAADPPQPIAPGGPLQFSLETLLLLTTLIAVCLGISVAVPPLGIPISIVALGGLIRTLVIGRQHLYLKVPFPIGEKIAEFIISCGVIVGAIGVGGLTLFFTCCVGGMAAASMDRLSQTGNPGNVGDVIGSVVAVAYMCVAAVAPIFTTIWFLWATRPR